jgi:hypothetical protein
MDLFKTKKSPARGWLLVLGALTLVGVAVLLSSCTMEEEAPPNDVQTSSRPKPLVTPEDVEEALKGAITLVIDEKYEGTWKNLLKIIQAACKNMPGKTVKLDISATSLAVAKNGVFDPRDSSGNPYDTGEPYITKLTLPNAATAIAGGNADNETFKGFTGLVEVSADKVKTINQCAFYGCPALEKASFREVIGIGMGAFAQCPALVELYLREVPPALLGNGGSSGSLFMLQLPGDNKPLIIYVPNETAVEAYKREWDDDTYGNNHKSVVITAK